MKDKKIRSRFAQVMNDSTQPTLIAGDSFSHRWGTDFSNGTFTPWYASSWLDIWPDARCVAQSGCSNWAIMNQLKDEPLQPAVINFTHLFRSPIKRELSVANNYNIACILSRRCVKKIIKRWRNHAIFWTPFFGYEQFDEVLKFHVDDCFNNYDLKPSKRFDIRDGPGTANHMTEPGLAEFRDFIQTAWAKTFNGEMNGY